MMHAMFTKFQPTESICFIGITPFNTAQTRGLVGFALVCSMSRKNQAYLFIIQKSHGIKLIYIGKRLPNKDGGCDVFRSSDGSS